VRFALLFGLACTLACLAEKNPPLLGDSDSSAPPAPGSGGGPIPGGDGGASDGGTTLAAASSPLDLAVAGGFVYYTNFGEGTVSVVSTSGGSASDLATGLDGPTALVVTGGTVYFTLAPTAGTGGVSSVPITGGSPASVQTNVTGAAGIATDGVNLYWTNDSGGVLIEQVAVGGGTPKQLQSFGGDVLPTRLALSGSDLYVPTSGTQAAVLWGTTSGASIQPLDTQSTYTYADVAVGDTVVYASIDDVAPAGAIVSFPRHGGVATTVAPGLNHPQRLALDGSNLYFTDPAGGNVWVKNVTTSDAPVLFASGLNAPLPIAVADAVYVGDVDAIVRIPKL